MNVRKVKRISKRSVSMLLSILMVLSVFTVCMVGTTITASAADLTLPWDATIKVNLTGHAKTEWKCVYLIISNGSAYKSIYLGSVDANGSVTSRPLQKFNYTWFFFSNDNQSYSTDSGANWNSIPKYNKTQTWNNDSNGSTYRNLSLAGDRIFNNVTTVDNTAVPTVSYTETTPSSSATWIDATLYNYRTDAQVGIAENQNALGTTDAEKYEIDRQYGMAYNNYDLRTYEKYNLAVKAWFGGSGTPLYQGNFRPGNDQTGEKGTLGKEDSTDWGWTYRNTDILGSFSNFVSVANGANRQNGANGSSTNAAAQSLVDSTLNANNTLKQGGIELPQFSSAFTTANPTLQSEYTGLKFQVKTSSKNSVNAAKPNKWYSYNAASDGNRSLMVSTKKIVATNAFKGRKYDRNATDNYGYYPFNIAQTNDVINCFGTKFEIQFYMTNNGKFNEEPLKFSFTGDDDLWVFIDDYLVLDLGGSHNQASGYFDLSTEKSYYTSGVYNSYGNGSGTAATDYNASRSWSSSSTSSPREVTFSNELKAKLHEDYTKPHTLRIFSMERGTYDSNLSFEYMLPSYEDMNTFELTHKVDASGVNAGLKLETMSVANNDVFDVQLKTQNMNAGGDNLAHIPVNENFTRKSPNYNYLSGGIGTKTDTLQEAKSGTKRTDINEAESSHSDYQPVKAYYQWDDSSKQLDINGDETTVDSAVNSGVGKPLNHGYISLLYDQTAKFYNQFPSTKQGSYTPLVQFSLDTDLSEFTTSHDATTGIIGIQTSHLNRKHNHFYGSYVRAEGGSYLVTPQGAPSYLEEGDKNFSAGGEYYITGKNTSLTYTHKIKTGTFSVEKILAEGEYDDSFEYDFKIEYQNLFGNGEIGDDKWKLAINLRGKMYSVTRTEGQPDTRTYVADRDVGSEGIVGLQADHVVVFEGIPVDTRIRITEITKKNTTDGSPNNDKYSTVSDIKFNGTSYVGDDINSAFDTIDEQSVTVQTKPNADNPSVTDYYTEIKPYSTPPTGKVAEGVSWKDIYNYKFYNSYSNTPILYRYIDRDIINGKPTARQAEGYTYFAKEIPGAIDSYLSSEGSLTDATKDRIADLSPQIINVLDSFKLDKNDAKCKFGTVTVKRATSDGKTTYAIDSSKDLGDDFEWGQTAVSDDGDVDKSVGLEDSLEAFFKGEDGTIKFLLAQYDNVARTYDVTVEYIKPDTATTDIKSFNVPFNGTANLGSQLSDITVDYGNDNQGNPQSTTYSLGNELYKIHVEDNRDIYFAYWEREVTYYSGGVLTTEYVPVSTNFNYNYRVTDNVHLRAVYVDEKKFNGKYRRYVEGKSLSEEPEYVHFDSTSGKTPFMGYDTVKKTKRVRYWIQPAGGSETDRKYSKIEGGPYTIAYADRETAWTDWADDEDTFKINGYCVPNSDGDRGFASAATDRLYNSYSKEEATTTEGVTTYSRADYTRVDVMFGSVGTYDNDSYIQNVGYILFQNNGSYPDLSTISKKNLQDIVKYSKDQIDNGQVPTAQDYKDAVNNPDKQEEIDNMLSANGKVWYAMNKHASNSNNPTNYNVRVGKFTVVGSGFGDGDDGKGYKYVTDNNGKVTKVEVNSGYNKLGLGKVNLTNKNRLDIVFDIPNTEQTRQNYYACYTYMIRDGQLYISTVPTTFTPNDVKPDEKNPDGKKAYIINSKSYMYDPDAAGTTEDPKETDTPAGDYGSVTSSFSTAIDGKTLSFHINTNTTNPIEESDGKKYVGEFVKLVVGNKTYSPSDLVNGNITHIFKADKNNTTGSSAGQNDVDVTASTLEVKAYFKKVLAGATFNISPITGIDLNVSQISGTVIGTGAVTEANTEVTVIYGSTVRVTATLKDGYNWVKAADDLADYTQQDPNNARSVRYRDYTLPANGSLNTIDVYSDLGASGSDTEVAEITYTLTVEAGANGSVTVTKPNGGTATVTSSTVLNDRKFTVRYTDANKTFTLNATPTNTSAYRFKNWTGTATTTTNPLSVTVNADTNYKANFESTAKKVYFAFIKQDANDPYPRDGNIGSSCVINGKTYTISYKDSESFTHGSTSYTGSDWKWSGTYQAYFSGSTITNAAVNMTFEGLYNIDGGWNPVYSAELPAGYSTSGSDATKVKFYPTEGQKSYDSAEITVGENVVYVAKGSWDTSGGDFLIENKGNISNFTKADGTN